MALSDRHRDMIEELAGLYSMLDAQAAILLEKSEIENNKPVSCAKGCDHCCYQLTAIVFAEGVNLAYQLLQRPDWKGIVHKLRDVAKKAHGPKLTRGSYFLEHNPCPFLNVNKGLCSIYEHRPSACRYMYVVSPADDCSVTKPGHRTLGLNTTMLETVVWQFSTQFTGGMPVGAPMPLMVLHVLPEILQTKKKHSWAKRMCQGIPTPFEWMDEAVKNEAMTGEETESSKAAVRESMDAMSIFAK